MVGPVFVKFAMPIGKAPIHQTVAESTLWAPEIGLMRTTKGEALICIKTERQGCEYTCDIPNKRKHSCQNGQTIFAYVNRFKLPDGYKCRRYILYICIIYNMYNKTKTALSCKMIFGGY